MSSTHDTPSNTCSILVDSSHRTTAGELSIRGLTYRPVADSGYGLSKIRRKESN